MNTKHWGEFDALDPQTYAPKMNFSSIIELAAQPTVNQSLPPKLPLIEMPPKNSLAVHTIHLHNYAQQLRDILHNAEAAMMEGSRLDLSLLPPMPESPQIENKHEPVPPLNHVEKDYCDFSKGIGPRIYPVCAADKRLLLQQCAAISLSQIGVMQSTKSVIETLADALDQYLLTMTKLMRTVADREAMNASSGFPDLISKVLADIGVSGLHEFYQNRVIKYHDKVQRECYGLLRQCQNMANADLPQQLKLDDVPELHFPAALSEVFTPSLEPGFQMLHSLEQEELGLDLLDSNPTGDLKIDVEYTQQ